MNKNVQKLYLSAAVVVNNNSEQGAGASHTLEEIRKIPQMS